MAKTPFYKRTKPGALNSAERNLVTEIQSICKENGVDLSSLDKANSVEGLQDLKTALEMQHGSLKPKSEVKKPAVETPAVETPAVETPAVETPSVEKPPFVDPTIEKQLAETPVASEFKKSNQSVDFADFVAQDNSNPFAVEVKTENRDYASGKVNVGEDSTLDVNEGNTDTAAAREPAVDDVSAVDEPAATDSVSSPWDVNTDDEVEVKNRDGEVDEMAKSDDPEKVKLAETTKKKATKHICKQAANLYAIVVEKTGKWSGQISEKKLTKMEESGEIDRYYVVNPESGQTVEGFVDDHNNRLGEMVKLDDDVKDDFQEALELVMEKHAWEVTPEVNLAIVAISGVATVIKQGRDCRKESMKVLIQTSKNFKLLTHQMQQKDAENDALKAKLEKLQGTASTVEPTEPTPRPEPRIIQLPVEEDPKSEPDEEIKKGSWAKKDDDLLEPSGRKPEITGQDNNIDGEKPLIEKRPNFAKRKPVVEKKPVAKKTVAKKTVVKKSAPKKKPANKK